MESETKHIHFIWTSSTSSHSNDFQLNFFSSIEFDEPNFRSPFQCTSLSIGWLLKKFTHSILVYISQQQIKIKNNIQNNIKNDSSQAFFIFLSFSMQWKKNLIYDQLLSFLVVVILSLLLVYETLNIAAYACMRNTKQNILLYNINWSWCGESVVDEIPSCVNVFFFVVFIRYFTMNENRACAYQSIWKKNYLNNNNTIFQWNISYKFSYIAIII